MTNDAETTSEDSEKIFADDYDIKYAIDWILLFNMHLYSIISILLFL